MAINIITYSGKTRTAKHDAIVYDAALNRSGIFNGCNVTANGNVLTVSSGYGIIKGRVFEISQEDFSVTLPGSGSRYGALIVTLNLGNTPPLIMETISSSSSTFNLTRNENANFSNSQYQMLLATYNMTSSGITNIVKAAHMLPSDAIGSKNLNDYVEPGVYYLFDMGTGWKNRPASDVVNGWLVVYKSPQNASTIKQVFYRHGSQPTHYQSFMRTCTGGTWQSWTRVVTYKDFVDGINSNAIFGEGTTRESTLLSVVSKTRHIGLHVSSAKNAGIWDTGKNNWILRSDNDGSVEIPHKLTVSSFTPVNINAGDAASTDGHYVNIKNKYRSVGLHVSNAENGGLYDFGNNRWILLNSKTGATTFPSGNVGFDHAIRSPKSIVRGTTNISHKKKNEAVYKDVTWPEMAGVPTVMLTPHTSVPQNVKVGIANVTKTGCRIYMTRSDDPGAATTIAYLAIYTY